MPVYTINTEKQPMTLRINLETTNSLPQKIHVIIKDAIRPNTVYTDRWATIQGKEAFNLFLPIMPEKADIIVFNKKNGVQKEGVDKTFTIINFKKTPLLARMTGNYAQNRYVHSFINFVKEFADSCGVYSVGKYLSDDGIFKVDFKEVISDDITKKEMNTPARISLDTGIIEVSKKQFNIFTVPKRVMILLHEFAHFYMNGKKQNEFEADLHAAAIYIGMGFPISEGLDVFAKVFYGNPTEANAKRLQQLEKHMRAFYEQTRNVKLA